MGGEMVGEEEIRVWRKAIPEGRDRWQSRVLVWVVGAALVYYAWHDWVFAYEFKADTAQKQFAVWVLVVSLTFAMLVWALRAATPIAAICGGLICELVLLESGLYHLSLFQSGLAPLMTLFAATFAATRAGRTRKMQAGLAERRKGRSAAQVIANLGAAGLLSTTFTFGFLNGLQVSNHPSDLSSILVSIMVLAALVEATADTVSSEIGQAFGGRPVMVLSLKRVEVGTDGAVSLIGSGAGILAGALVALVGMWGLRLSFGEMGIALVAGVCGLFFDSLLGATLERRGWLGNDLVNFSSTVFAAGVAALIYRVVVFGW